jgi:hypothetical protein
MKVNFLNLHFVVYVIDVIFVNEVVEKEIKLKLLTTPRFSKTFGKTVIAVDKAPK